MHNVQKIVMMRYGYRDENARAETWNPYDDAQLVSVDAEVLKARLGDWNRAIVDRRVKELKKANVEAEKSIASTIARESAVGKLTPEDKTVLRIRDENFGAQRDRYRKEIEQNEALLQKLTSSSLNEIMSQGLVSYWWVFEPADIQTFEDFEASLSDDDDE
ncbi:hypothetical protein [Rhizobium sp. MHM7A]|uniref:hypothetical protein n=1 Tax=Rhizobium sp. MHM7A TaxID=2583233 RepID=UPI001106F99C|nr:hypothetical protein [Rhizobium sp. MHM7A]TLX16010.1 hypothetical protein FFR93_01445 [Rhizobium sp. MHM7A]